jgi:hypothetical protein
VHWSDGIFEAPAISLDKAIVRSRLSRSNLLTRHSNPEPLYTAMLSTKSSFVFRQKHQQEPLAVKAQCRSVRQRAITTQAGSSIHKAVENLPVNGSSEFEHFKVATGEALSTKSNAFPASSSPKPQLYAIVSDQEQQPGPCLCQPATTPWSIQQ